MAEHAKVTRAATDISTKVAAATLGGAVATIGIWGIEAGFGIDLPQLVEGAITTLVVFAAGWIPKDRLPTE